MLFKKIFNYAKDRITYKKKIRLPNDPRQAFTFL